jgi:hypothetical protein
MAITSERGKRKLVDLKLSATHTVWWLLMPKGYFVLLKPNKQKRLAMRAFFVWLKARALCALAADLGHGAKIAFLFARTAIAFFKINFILEIKQITHGNS